MMEYRFNMELLDIVDENGKPTGETVERKTAHSEGIRHRTAHVWIVRKSDEGAEVLLQKRAMNKDSFPGRYDTSSAGHIQAGDEPEESAIRELHEELGIKASVDDLQFVDTFVIQYEKEFYGTLNFLLCLILTAVIDGNNLHIRCKLLHNGKCLHNTVVNQCLLIVGRHDN